MLHWLPSWLSEGVGLQIMFGFTGYIEYQHYSLHLLMTANRFITFGTQDFRKVSAIFSSSAQRWSKPWARARALILDLRMAWA